MRTCVCVSVRRSEILERVVSEFGTGTGIHVKILNPRRDEVTHSEEFQ